MQKNIFLTGERQVGKTTAIQRVLDKLQPVTIGGFRTSKIENAETGKSDVIFYPANDTKENGHVVAQWKGGVRDIFPDIFDTYGPDWLSSAADLILMDELGFLESESLTFQDAVMKTLTNSTPVLGVIRNGKSTPFLDSLRQRKDIRIITVTETNRDTIPEKIVEIIREAGLSR